MRIERATVDLVRQMAGREVSARYRGAWGGLGWLILAPLLMLAIYTFVFAVIFKARWPQLVGASGGSGEFAVIVFSGMLLHGFLADNLARAPGLVTGNVNLVKKTVFPLELLAGVQLVASLAHMLPSLGILILFNLIVVGLPPPTVFLFPLVLLPLALFSLGFTWAVSAMAVYMRDLSQVVALLVTGMFFLSPVLYPASVVPESVRWLLFLNPLTYAIEMGRDLLFWGTIPSPSHYLVYLGVSAASAIAGLWVFRALRDGFADAL